jgi:phosphatidylglycerol---prolipoprotein diacylglyceryl transferase
MITFVNNGIVIFGFKIAYYGLLMGFGGLLGAVLSTRETRRHGFDTAIVWQMLPWLFVTGLIGARIWHVLTPSSSILVDGRNPYFINPLKILNFRQGGLGIPGAVMAAILTIWVYTRKNKLSFASWLDIGAPGLALAQAIGRWGNYFNQEIYGLPTNATKFPFAIYIDPAHRFFNHLTDAYYLPTFFYECLWNLFNMFLLLWLPRKLGDRMKPGDNALVYLIVYPVGRFFLEYLRLVNSPVAGININQTLMAVVAVCSTVALIIKHSKNKGKKLSAQPLS